TIFSGWIYDHLKPHAAAVKVAHPLMLRASAASKKKNDQIDAGKLADCLRCDFLPECYMASTGIRERRRTLRCRHLLVRQVVQLKNRVSSLLMETGVSYNKQRLHRAGYFPELLASKDAIDKSIRPLLRLSRDAITRLQRIESALIRYLQREPTLAAQGRRKQRSWLPDMILISRCSMQERSRAGMPIAPRTAAAEVDVRRLPAHCK